MIIVPFTSSGQIDTVETINEYGWKEIKVYKNNRLEGMWKMWDVDGQLRFESNVTYGNEKGYQKWYHKNGRIWLEGSCVGEQKEGPWKMYFENGMLDIEIVYKNGQIISKTCWDMNTNEIECEQ